MVKSERDTAALPLPRDSFRKWIRVQEGAIEQVRIVAKKALEEGDREQCLTALKLQMKRQRELLLLFALPAPEKSQSAASESRSAFELTEHGPAKPPTPPPDFSKMSDEELERLVGATAAPSLVGGSRGPLPGTHGRPKGYPVSGAAKEQKERARERREREQREREAGEHPASEHDAAIASPVPIPGDWRE